MKLPQSTYDKISEYIRKIRDNILAKKVIQPEDRMTLLEKRIRVLESQISQQKLLLDYHRSVIKQLTKRSR